MTQFVPSDTQVAQFPTTPKRIAVPAVVLSIGTTLLEAEISVWACIFLKVNSRPVLVDAEGKVTVQVEPDLLLMNQVSPAPTVKSAVFVIGAETVLAVEANVPAEKDSPEPTVTLLKPPDPLPYRIDEPLVAGA